MRSFVRAILFGSMIAMLVPVMAAQTEAQRPEGSADEVVTAPAVSVTQTAKHSPLTVTFSEGRLMIAAENCSLQEILNAVRLQTGAIIEGSAMDSSRVTVQLGPDDPMKVLASLLYGTRFNYIIVAGVRGANPEKIVLTARGATTMSAPPPVVAQAVAPVIEKKEAEQSEEKKLAALVEGEEKAPKKDDEKAAKDKDKDETAKDTKAADDQDVLAKNALKNDGEAGSEPTMAERIANLPEGIDPAIARLYPSLFGGSKTADGSSGSAFGNGQSVGGYDPMPGSQASPVPTPWSGANLPTNSAGMPILPSNISPEIWNLYPKNVMDLVRNGGTNPAAAVIPNGPLAPNLPSGPIGLWDQTIKGTGGH